jgi:hypothetical protein
MRNKIKSRLKGVGSVLGAVLWRGFGLFLFILGGAAGTGAIVTGDWFTGVLIAWLTLMLGVIGAIGYAIATTGEATSDTVARATQDAVQKAGDKASK